MHSDATRVDFYVLQADGSEARLRFACRLAEKACKQQCAVFALADGEAAARELDELLWTFRAESFVPHALAGSPEGAAAPVTIAGDEGPAPQPGDVLINLRAEVPTCYDSFRRVVEIVDASDQGRRDGRERFAFYRDNGLEPQTHRID